MFSSVLGGAEPASFAEATLNGWAPDGGMYWPTIIEPVTQETLVAWGGLSYPRLCEEVLKRFIPADDPDISPADLASIVSAAFDAFGSNSVLHVQPLGDGDGEAGLHVVELWHGPTYATQGSRTLDQQRTPGRSCPATHASEPPPRLGQVPGAKPVSAAYSSPKVTLTPTRP